ncbi:alpha-L-rhamnosidase N-terminal domain-containing protein, partial [candidate division KSB1 bacterium]|nr:alpha-L-rhamnosidase N-terminal domain-containing protein [candidate division KSB1 bacterium]
MRTLLQLFFFVGLMCFTASVYPNASLLQRSMIWSPGGENAVVFRKTFTIPKLGETTAHLFADSYYALYVNGNYVLCGPSRFDPKRPEYDTLPVTAYLKQGLNTIAVLVYGGISNGMRMQHAPGFAMLLQGDDFTVFTDSTWKCSGNTRFKTAVAKWQGFDETINATNSTGDCLGVGFDDSAWQNAVNIKGDLWGPFFPRSIPLLSEKEIKCELQFPVQVDSTLTVHFDRNFLLTAELNFSATEKAEVRIGNTTYSADPGSHSFRTFDAFGITDASCTLSTSVPITIQNIRFLNRIYPFERHGSFSCSDPVLDRLWEMSLHTLEQVTEDGYQDCPWERAEWMGDAAVIEYPLTRVTLVGEGNVLSDSRLIRKMIRDIAQSADSTGRIKAHHPSDRFDIHAY